ncbi:MAG: flagellar export chaperone FliS [Kiloniellaceae bacterium]
MNRQLQTYGTQQVMTSDPVTLVALLYDKAVLSLKAAVKAIRDNQIENRWRANNRAVEIIKHLLMTLDMEKGGEIASNLEAIYAYILRRLVDVDVNNDSRAAEEAIALLEPLRASWTELARATGNVAVDDPKLRTLAAAAPADGEAAGPGAPDARIGADPSPAAVGTVCLSA